MPLAAPRAARLRVRAIQYERNFSYGDTMPAMPSIDNAPRQQIWRCRAGHAVQQGRKPASAAKKDGRGYEILQNKHASLYMRINGADGAARVHMNDMRAIRFATGHVGE